MQVIGAPQQIEVVQEQLQPSSMDHLMRRLQQEAAHKFDIEHDAALVRPITLAGCCSIRHILFACPRRTVVDLAPIDLLSFMPLPPKAMFMTL